MSDEAFAVGDVVIIISPTSYMWESGNVVAVRNSWDGVPYYDVEHDDGVVWAYEGKELVKAD